MSKNNKTIDEIAEALGRSFNSVKLRLYGNGTKFRKENQSWGKPLNERVLVEGEAWVRAKIILGKRLTVKNGRYHLDGLPVSCQEIWRLSGGRPNDDKRWI